MLPTTNWRRRVYSVLKWLLLSAKVVRDTGRLGYEYVWDFVRVWRYSSAVLTGNGQAKLAALITMGYHGIEKGLALPDPRPGFGNDAVRTLIRRLERYGAAFGFDENAAVALNALRSYCQFCLEHHVLSPELLGSVESLARFVPPDGHQSTAGGTRLVRREEFLEHARINLTEFMESRASVRQFVDREVSMQDIEFAVALARKAPSACNRQSSRVYVLVDRSRIEKALRIQGGARGFGQEVPMLLIATSDLACFQSPGERSQALIDGGLFAMSLIFGLHSLGLVTCCLNWSKTHKVDNEFRREFPIPPQETIIMLIAVGHPKEEYMVAASHRRPVHELIRVL